MYRPLHGSEWRCGNDVVVVVVVVVNAVVNVVIVAAVVVVVVVVVVVDILFTEVICNVIQVKVFVDDRILEILVDKRDQRASKTSKFYQNSTLQSIETIFFRFPA